MLEKGLNRFKENEIKEDNINQSNARLKVLRCVDIDIDIETQENMSIWDWEFFRNKELVAIGEYRRRFCDFGTYSDFQFSMKKFNAMLVKTKRLIPAYMFVEFNDQFVYFALQDGFPTKIMKRNHEIRTEECVCVANEFFKSVYKFDLK